MHERSKHGTEGASRPVARPMKRGWSEIDSSETLHALCQSKGCVVMRDSGIEMEEWFSRVNSNTKVQMKCKACSHVASIQLKRFVREEGFPCFCGGRIRVASAAWYERFSAIVLKTRFVLVGFASSVQGWIHRKPCAQTTIEVRCCVCDKTVNCRIWDFQQNKSAKCACNADWKTLDGRARLLSAVRQSRFELIDWASQDDTWVARKPGASTYLPLRCTICNDCPQRAELKSFFTRKSADCSCKHKTERLVFDYCSQIPDVQAARQYHLPGCKSSKGWSMPFDVALYHNGRVILLIEVDGDHHFGTGRAPWHCKAVVNNDLLKEQIAASAKIPILRLYQPEVLEERIDWRNILLITVQQACEGLLSGVGWRTGCAVYESGVYRRARM